MPSKLNLEPDRGIPPLNRGLVEQSAFAANRRPWRRDPLRRMAPCQPIVAILASSRAAALIDESAYASGRLVLTRPGRLLADAVIRDLT